MTILDAPEPLSSEEMAELRQYARERIDLWLKRAFYATTALLVSCGLLYPFLKGHPLHRYWDAFGKYLIFVSMILLVVFIWCTGFCYSAWQALRDVEKENSETSEGRA
jgi:Na+/melibiose symporter-like transporter